jgi:hypothetical protein
MSALGTTVLAFDLEVSAILGLFVSILLAVGCCTCMWAFVTEKPLRSAIPATVTGTVVWMLAIGLSYLMGAWGLVLMALLLALAPHTVTVLLEWLVADDEAGAGPSLGQLLRDGAWQDADPAEVTGRPPDVSDLASMSVSALGRLWQDSATELSGRPDWRRQLELVEIRAACLDQLRERDEPGYLRWLAAGPLLRAPSEFLHPHSTRPRTS